MKKFLFFTTACAALVACGKEVNAPQKSADWFDKGERVTLCIAKPCTKATASLNGNSGVDFKWESTDEIKVTVGTETAKFTVSNLSNGGASAEFTGEMPASGETFDVQFPFDGVDESVLSSQTYTSGETIQKGKMLFKKNGCTRDMALTLDAQYAALRLNLYGTGQTISKIIVTNTTADPNTTDTLYISPAVTLPAAKTDSMAFFIVVPAGSYSFSAEVFDNASTPASICSFATTSANVFNAGTVLNMSAKEVKKAPAVLLPGEFSVSQTKKVNFTRGNLYYSATDAKYHIEQQQNVTYKTLSQKEYDATHVCLFFWSNTTDWETFGNEPWAGTYSFSTQSTKLDKFFCGIDNSMTVDGQSDLYVLTGGPDGEWNYLINSRDNATNLYKYGVSVATSVGTVTNCLVIAPDGYTGSIEASYDESAWADAESAGLVCLPAAGHRNGLSYSSGSYGYCWSATTYGSSNSSAYYLSFKNSQVNTTAIENRGAGLSVRLVSVAR